jgi:hypothetical protein
VASAVAMELPEAPHWPRQEEEALAPVAAWVLKQDSNKDVKNIFDFHIQILFENFKINIIHRSLRRDRQGWRRTGHRYWCIILDLGINTVLQKQSII